MITVQDQWNRFSSGFDVIGFMTTNQSPCTPDICEVNIEIQSLSVSCKL